MFINKFVFNYGYPFYIGNESGLGEIRRNELESSCIILGIETENININRKC